MPTGELKNLLLKADPAFWPHLAASTRSAKEFDELFRLSALRKKAHARHLPVPGVSREKFRVVLLGGYSLYPFHELLEHLCEMAGQPVELWRGEFDNYISEIMDGTGGLYEFKPQAVVLMPSEHRCKYTGQLADPREAQQAEAGRVVNALLDLVRRLHEKARAEIIITNFMLPARHDLGAFRSRTLGSDWAFRKWVNFELGFNAPPYLHICDLEFLAHRIGGLAARDERAWFESKQPGSPALLERGDVFLKRLERLPARRGVADLNAFQAVIRHHAAPQRVVQVQHQHFFRRAFEREDQMHRLPRQFHQQGG